ncbi:MAG: hypothetical protein J0H29_11795 [Sphingobacteriales bacterium]|nr:hypothetical protein [Sphingobacteriales bacterium]
MNKKAIADNDNMIPRKKDDPLLKAAFEELFAHLLRFCYHAVRCLLAFVFCATFCL